MTEHLNGTGKETPPMQWAPGAAASVSSGEALDGSNTQQHAQPVRGVEKPQFNIA